MVIQAFKLSTPVRERVKLLCQVTEQKGETKQKGLLYNGSEK